MRKFRHLWIDIYETNVYFIKCSRSVRDIQIKKLCGNIPKISDTCDAHTYRHTWDAGRGYVIWVTSWRDLTHELLHCVHWILDDVGMSLTDASEEAYAYLIGYLDNQFRKG